MSKGKILIIGVVAAGLAVFGFVRGDGNDYAEHAAALDSEEVQQVETMLQRLQQSTNHLAEYLSADSNLMAQQQLLQRAQQLTEAIEVKVLQAEWSGDYFRVHVGSPSKANAFASHWFLLAADEAGALKLLGVQY
jgi:hypothetical protein